MAFEHLEQAVQQLQSAGQYDSLTNMYYNMSGLTWRWEIKLGPAVTS
jgi:hypothetical protein